MVPLATRRLLLVPLTPALAEAALAGRRLPGGLVAAEDWPGDDAAVVLARVALTGDGAGQWLVVLPGDLVVGECGVRAWPQPDEPEIGYGLAPSARGRGYAVEAVARLAGHLLAQAGVRRVLAETDSGNPGSVRLLRRLGFAPCEPSTGGPEAGDGAGRWASPLRSGASMARLLLLTSSIVGQDRTPEEPC